VGTPGGMLFEYECCGQKKDIYKIMECSAEYIKPTGCKMQLHNTTEAYGTSIEKLKRTMNRVISHQLIILENQPAQMIEDIIVTEL
jgi:hypothetical protein